VHKVLAEDHDQGRYVGALKWDPSEGDVQHVQVDDDYRRQGVATGMWNYAQGLKGVQTPIHAPSDERTNAGNAWVKAVKGPGARRTFQ
jgi:GNAT superfamily N-acetyltransferase